MDVISDIGVIVDTIPQIFHVSFDNTINDKIIEHSQEI